MNCFCCVVGWGGLSEPLLFSQTNHISAQPNSWNIGFNLCIPNTACCVYFPSGWTAFTSQCVPTTWTKMMERPEVTRDDNWSRSSSKIDWIHTVLRMTIDIFVMSVTDCHSATDNWHLCDVSHWLPQCHWQLTSLWCQSLTATVPLLTGRPRSGQMAGPVG